MDDLERALKDEDVDVLADMLRQKDAQLAERDALIRETIEKLKNGYDNDCLLGDQDGNCSYGIPYVKGRSKWDHSPDCWITRALGILKEPDHG